MTPTTIPVFAPDFVKELVPWMVGQFGIATEKAFRIIWNIGMKILVQHWISIIIFLIIIFVIAFVRAFITGRWAMLGSVVYNYLYFGTLFTIGLIFGPGTFANDYFKIFLVVLYIICFIITDRFLRKIGVRRF